MDKEKIEINGETYVKEKYLEEQKKEIDLRERFIIEPANVLAIIPLIKEHEGMKEEYDSKELGGFFYSYKLLKDPKIMINVKADMKKWDSIWVGNTKYSYEYIKSTKKMAKAFGLSDEPSIFMAWDKESKEWIDDQPLLLIFGEMLCFILAPRIGDKEDD